MNPVQNENTNVVLSRVAAGSIPFGRAVERAGVNKVCVFGGIRQIDGCEAAWTPSSNVLSAVDGTTKLVGSYSEKLTVQTAFTTGVAGYQDLPAALDLSAEGAITFLIRSDTAIPAGYLQIGISDGAAMGGANTNYTDLPALEAGKWTLVSVPYTGLPATRVAIASIGLNVVTDLSTTADVVIHVDEVRSGEVNYGFAGIANDDVAKENDTAELGEDVLILAGGGANATLDDGVTCLAEQQLYPVPGSGKLTTTEIVMAGRKLFAAEDMSTSSWCEVIFG